MSTHKYIDKICCVAIVFALLLTVVFMNAKSLGIEEAAKIKGYESRLFDTSTVHSIDIVMEDWDSFLSTCMNEEYSLCSVVIDNEVYKNVAIRAKGNTSLTQVQNYGNNRYSFKIEFDHYDSTKSYYGLDKLSLNNIIQDNTYMKDYLTYQLMDAFGADAPLCSYASISVNGENWGLYLAVEGVEEAFLERNYGSDYGELYKPDSQSMGGGRGNGGNFTMDDWQSDAESQQRQQPTLNGGDGENSNASAQSVRTPTDDTSPPSANGGRNQDFAQGGMQRPDSGMGGMQDAFGSSDVSLIYSDDAYSSYSNIFDNAKTDVTDADKDRLIASIKQLNAYENLEEVVNVEEVIRYFVVHNFVCNFDSYTGSMIHNYYLYEEDGQLSMIPWDYNLAFGGFQGAQDATELVNYPIDTPVSGGTMESRPMLMWIFSSDEYTQLYHQYFAEFIADYFDSGCFAQMMDEVQSLISPYVQEDPTKFCTYEEFETGLQTLKEFCLLRAESISGQLDGAIPSTSDGQAQQQETLVDASSITISDMGNMNNGMGGAMQGQGNRGGFSSSLQPPTQAQGETSQNDAQSAAASSAPDEAAQSEGNPAPPQNQQEGQFQGIGGPPADENADRPTPPGWSDENQPPSGQMPDENQGVQPPGSGTASSASDEAAQSEEFTTPPQNQQEGQFQSIDSLPADENAGRPAPPGWSDENQPQNGQMPGERQDIQSPANGAGFDGGGPEGWLWLGISAAVLLAGILLAALYPKHA